MSIMSSIVLKKVADLVSNFLWAGFLLEFVIQMTLF